MQLHLFRHADLNIGKDRQRKLFDPRAITDLAASIAEVGLIEPVVVRKEGPELLLVAGERRIRALEICWNLGQEVRCGGKVIPEDHIPAVYLGEIDPILAFEIELEENIRRTDLSWQERAIATQRLMQHRTKRALRENKAPPTLGQIAAEIVGSDKDTIAGATYVDYRENLLLAQNMANPVVAKAATKKDAMKALRRDEETRKNAELGRSIGATFTSAVHTLLVGDCLEHMAALPAASFDVILTDPPYGIDAQDYGDSAGKTGGAHFYDDSPQVMWELMLHVQKWLFHVAKPQAHLYMFCDVEHFVKLRDLIASRGWKCFRTPLIWMNPTSMRAPWPEAGPQRKWQMVLYANKGSKPVTRLYGDVLTYPSDPNLGHQAQKPVALYRDLLQRSIRPGDAVLDPFCGTGTIFPACHELKCRATGIELDPAAAGIASKRLGELK